MSRSRRIIQRITQLCFAAVICTAALLSPGTAQAQSNASHLPGGIITTFAGVPPGGSASGGDGVAPTSYAFYDPTAVATDAAGNVYIVDANNSTPQVLVVYLADPAPPLLAYRLNNPPAPYAPITAQKGNIYIIAGTSDETSVPCGTGNGGGGETCGDGGSALAATLNTPEGISVDSAGNLYIADELSIAIRKVTASTGKISTIVGDPQHIVAGYGGENVIATGSLLSYPSAVVLDASGDLFIADGNAIIRRVDATTNKITTVAGTVPNSNGAVTCMAGPCGDGGLATSAQLGYVPDLYVASNGDLYLTDEGTSTVRKVTAATKIIETIAGTMPPAGSADPFPDTCTALPCGDGGAATAALLNFPYYAALDSVGNLLIADTSDGSLRYVDASGKMQAAVGQTTMPGYTGDTGTAIAAQLNGPQDFAFDVAGNLYIADALNAVIRKVAIAASLPTQTITFATLPNVTYGVAAFTLDATASSNLAVTYTVSGPATVSGSSLHVTGAGSITVTANQGGNSSFAAATPVSQTFTAAKAQLTVTATSLSREANASNPPLTYAITGLVNGDAGSVVSGTPVLTTTATTSSPIGTYPITITNGTLAALNYNFTLVNGTLTISGGASQTITFAALPNIAYGSPASTFTLSATATSGLPVTFSVTGPAVLQGNSLTVNGAGTVVVTAQQQGNGSFAAAASVVRTFTVNPAVLTISAANASRGYGQPNPVFTINPPTGFVGGDTVAVLTGGPVFSTTATATSDPGNFPITLIQGTLFSPNYTFVFVPGTLTVTQAMQTITFPPIPALTGNLGSTYILQATATSGLPVQYSSTGVVTILAGGTLYVNGPGTGTVTATQAGNTDYAPATPVTQTIAVGLVPLNVVATSATRPFGGNNPAFTYSYLSGGAAAAIVPGSVSGTPTLSSPATATSPTGTYPIVISPGTLTSTLYALTFVNGTLTITPPASYTLTVDPGSVSIPVGQSRQVTVTLTPINNYAGSVTLGCTGLPAGVTCVSSPTSLTADGTGNIVQCTLTISAGQVVASTQSKPTSLFAADFYWLSAALGGLIVFVSRRKLRRASPASFLGLFLLMIASAGGLSACGGNSGHGTTIQPGTTQVMVTGTGTSSAGSADTSQSVALTVVIQ